ncbi:MAG: DUF975 family protein [Muricomes sp.]
MWTRAELKMRGKQNFKGNYWSAVAVALVMSIVTATYTTSSSSGARDSLNPYRNDGYFLEYSLFWMIIAVIGGILAIGMMLLNVFVGNVLMVGGYRFFVLNQKENVTAGSLGYGFKSGHYGNIVLIMFLRDLFTFLWTLLLIVPGIIKHYEYLMVPYILSENPGMKKEEAFLISRKMMEGQKWNTFVLDLSFLGWRILEGLTFGILGIFYVEPYIQATIAELYTANKTMAYQNGYIR